MRAVLGSKTLCYKSLSTMLALFDCPAHVKVFVQLCHFGALTDRLQGQSDALLLCSAKASQLSSSDSRSIRGRFQSLPFTFAFGKSSKFCFDPDTIAWTSSGHHISCTERVAPLERGRSATSQRMTCRLL